MLELKPCALGVRDVSPVEFIGGSMKGQKGEENNLKDIAVVTVGSSFLIDVICGFGCKSSPYAKRSLDR